MIVLIIIAVITLTLIIGQKIDRKNKCTPSKQVKKSHPQTQKINPNLNKDIMFAVEEGNIQKVKSLLDKGADPNATDDFRNTPLFIALFERHGEPMIKILVEAGANINGSNNNGFPFIVSAASDNEIDDVKILLKYGANPNVLEHDSGTALGYASAMGFEGVVKTLLDGGADILQLHKDKPVLYWAAINQYSETVKLLLNYGADGNSVLNQAKADDDKTLIKFLSTHGIK